MGGYPWKYSLRDLKVILNESYSFDTLPLTENEQIEFLSLFKSFLIFWILKEVLKRYYK